MKIQLYFALFILLLPTASLSQTPTQHLTRNTKSVRVHKAELARQIPRWLNEYRVPAVGVAVIQNGKVEWADVFGEQALGIKATRNTIFNVASLTKPVFALMALHLSARGELNLDASLSDYWIDPDLVNDKRHRLLTPRIVLSHQTGFPNWRNNQKLSFAFDPGTKYQYSGEGMEYLKRAIERKMKRTMPDLAQSLVFAPARMSSTSFTWIEKNESRVAIGYDRVQKPYPVPKRTDPSAADDLLTTIDDYARFAVWVLHGAGLPASVWQELKSPQVKSQQEVNFGLGWQLLLGQQLLLTHGGSDQGVRAEVFLLPETRAGVVILTNSDNGDPLIQFIFEAALEQGQKLQDFISLHNWQYLEGLSAQELGQTISRVTSSPAIMQKLLRAIEAKYINPSELNDAEKQKAHVVFQSLISRLIAGTAHKEASAILLKYIFQPGPDSTAQINPTLSSDELRAFIMAAAKTIAPMKP